METYSSLGTIPVYYFDQINKSGDLTLLIINKKENTKHDLKALLKIWENIYSEFIAEFGVSETFILYLREMKAAIRHYIDVYINGNKAAINLAKVKVYDAEQLLKAGTESPQTVYALVSKFMGFRIDPLTVSAREFYQYLQLASKAK